MNRKVRTAVGSRETAVWKTETCDFPLVSEDYDSPKDTQSPHLRPKFTFRAAVLVGESPLYPVKRQEKVHMKRTVEELVALYESGFKLPKRTPTPPPVLPPTPPAQTQSPAALPPSHVASRLSIPATPKKRHSISKYPRPIITDPLSQSVPMKSSDFTPQDSPLLISLGKRVPAVGKVLSQGKGGAQATNDIFGRVKQAIITPEKVPCVPEVPSPTLMRLLEAAPPMPLIPKAVLPAEVISEVESQEDIPPPVPVPTSNTQVPATKVTIDVKQLQSHMRKSNSSSSLKRTAKVTERPETASLSRSVMSIPKVLVPQMPAFHSRSRAKSGWRLNTSNSENKSFTVLQNSLILGIFGNERLNQTLVEENKPPDIVVLGASQREPLDRLMEDNFKAKKLPPHRLAVDYNLFKGVRKVARLRLQMRKMRQQLLSL